MSMAKPFPLEEVSLSKPSPFFNAREKNLAYLLLLKPDRLLHRFHQNAHLPVKDSVYKGWESEGLSGHTLGHYLSAASMMVASTGNDTLKRNLLYIINELERCQKARGSGYIGAIPNEDSIFAQVKRGEIRSSGFDLNGGWSPWYTVHKILAGLLDTYQYTGDKKALSLAKNLGDWTYNTINHLPDSLLQKMLKCEYGGMNDALANLYQFTGNRKYLDLSYKFFDDFVMLPLSQQIDPLPGKHSNTNVPKAIGSALQYELTGNKKDSTIASFFWHTMVSHHSYVIGGNSNYEYCGPQDKLNDRLSDNTCETCNTYNMLKLTRHLNGWNPDARFMDYYERALYNHILASQNPENGMMCYFVPLRMGTIKQFSDSFNTFTCCVGSGIENHSKYQEQIYSHDDKNTIWINLFIPSTVNWKEKAVIMEMITSFPNADNFQIIFKHSKPTRLNIRIRKPFWQQGDPDVKVNGKRFIAETDSSGYYTVAGLFKKGDTISVVTPMHLYTEAMPDNPNRIAFKFGPLVLAGLLGKTMPDPVYGTPVLMTNERNTSHLLQRTNDNELVFRTANIGRPTDVLLKPFYQVYNEYYSVYWDYFSEAEWALRQKEYEEEKKLAKLIEEKTIDDFRIGEMQPERDHKLVASEKSYVDDAIGRKGREARAGNFFQFVMKIDPVKQNSLLLTYIGDDKDRKFDLIADGNKIATVEWKGGKTGKFYDFTYPLPLAITQGKSSITVRVEANYGKTAGRIFGVKTLNK
ncbi:MAG TPA: beta-L-arabinofuranosidase domain-containing protein [Chitinophagaceae bacterium]|nr:beta-L-arabinofuranosidase domain-containing protein [Chitinophagaceae bacterium]